jgi:hypothetical protein
VLHRLGFTAAGADPPGASRSKLSRAYLIGAEGPDVDKAPTPGVKELLAGRLGPDAKPNIDIRPRADEAEGDRVAGAAQHVAE